MPSEVSCWLYGGERKGPGRRLKWVDRLLSEDSSSQTRMEGSRMLYPGPVLEMLPNWHLTQQPRKLVLTCQKWGAPILRPLQLKMSLMWGVTKCQAGHENVPDGDHTDEVEDIMSELLDPVGESNVGGCLTEEFNHLNGHRL